MKIHPNTRRDFLKTLGLNAAALALSGCADGLWRRPGAGARPNIVLILVDDLGWADTGCYGSTYYETPSIDRLAADGMRFTNGYAACAVCSPTRASIMTGRYPARIGITDWIRARFQGGAIPDDRKNPTGYTGRGDQKVLCPRNPFWMELDETTIAEALKPAGYTSCHIGKWHLGTDDWYPEKQGFDYNIGGCDYGQPPSYFDPYRAEHGGIPTLEPRREGEYLTDREADEAVRFIRAHSDVPFFLNMCHYAVHTPIQGRPDLVEKYKRKEKTHQKNAAYAAMVESVDHSVGRIMDVLDELGLADDTMILFFSDNGGLAGVTSNAPLRSGKGFPYEGGIREPFIVCWSAVVKAGAVCHEPAISVDFFPTLCEAAGVGLPADRAIDGVSLMPLLRRERGLGRASLFWHFPHYRGGGVMPYSIVRHGDFKLIRRYDGKPYELFDLENDPSEKTDLSSAMPERVQELDRILSGWLEEVGAKIPIDNPDYDPDWKPEKKK